MDYERILLASPALQDGQSATILATEPGFYLVGSAGYDVKRVRRQALGLSVSRDCRSFIARREGKKVVLYAATFYDCGHWRLHVLNGEPMCALRIACPALPPTGARFRNSLLAA